MIYESVFDQLGKYDVQIMCQSLADQGYYTVLSNLIRINKKIYHSCQPLMIRLYDTLQEQERKRIPDEIEVGVMQRWLNKCGDVHRDFDQPAIILTNGTQFWFKNGQLHRENDLPSIICFDGTQCWHKNGLLHRENDQPAMILTNGSKQWYIKGEMYRETTMEK